MKRARNARILVVEDDEHTLNITVDILNNSGLYDVTGVGDVIAANNAVTKSLIEKKQFDLVLLDLHLGNSSGAEFGRRVIDIIGDMNIVVITGQYDFVNMLTYRVDDAIIKPVNVGTLLEVCSKTIEPLRRSANPYDIKLNLWLATKHLRGFESLKFHSRKMGDDEAESYAYVEKIISRAMRDGAYLTSVIYVNKKVDKNIVNVALSALLGCPGECLDCKNHRNRKNKSGKQVKFVRQLSEGEIVSQAYLALNNPHVKKLFRNNAKKMKLVFNLACEGDGLVWNLDNSMRAFEQLSTIENVEIELISTSIGSVEALSDFVRNHINIPKLRHYRSIDSLVPEVRANLKPGVANESLIKMRDLDELIASVTEKPVSISWVVMKGVNDSVEDAKMIKELYGNRLFFNGKSIFPIKLMRMIPGSMGDSSFSHAEETTMDDVIRFRDYLVNDFGIKDVRIRDIVGVLINASCGGCIVEWV